MSSFAIFRQETSRYSIRGAGASPGDAPATRRYSGQRAARMAIKGARPIVRRWWDPRVVRVLKPCWDADPRKRPSFHAILDMIEESDLEVEVVDDEAITGPVHATGKARDVRRPSIQTPPPDRLPEGFHPVGEAYATDATCACAIA